MAASHETYKKSYNLYRNPIKQPTNFEVKSNTLDLDNVFNFSIDFQNDESLLDTNIDEIFLAFQPEIMKDYKNLFMEEENDLSFDSSLVVISDSTDQIPFKIYQDSIDLGESKKSYSLAFKGRIPLQPIQIIDQQHDDSFNHKYTPLLVAKKFSRREKQISINPLFYSDYKCFETQDFSTLEPEVPKFAKHKCLKIYKHSREHRNHAFEIMPIYFHPSKKNNWMKMLYNSLDSNLFLKTKILDKKMSLDFLSISEITKERTHTDLKKDPKISYSSFHHFKLNSFTTIDNTYSFQSKDFRNDMILDGSDLSKNMYTLKISLGNDTIGLDSDGMIPMIINVKHLNPTRNVKYTHDILIVLDFKNGKSEFQQQLISNLDILFDDISENSRISIVKINKSSPIIKFCKSTKALISLLKLLILEDSSTEETLPCEKIEDLVFKLLLTRKFRSNFTSICVFCEQDEELYQKIQNKLEKYEEFFDTQFFGISHTNMRFKSSASNFIIIQYAEKHDDLFNSLRKINNTLRNMYIKSLNLKFEICQENPFTIQHSDVDLIKLDNCNYSCELARYFKESEEMDFFFGFKYDKSRLNLNNERGLLNFVKISSEAKFPINPIHIFSKKLQMKTIKIEPINLQVNVLEKFPLMNFSPRPYLHYFRFILRNQLNGIIKREETQNFNFNIGISNTYEAERCSNNINLVENQLNSSEMEIFQTLKRIYQSTNLLNSNKVIDKKTINYLRYMLDQLTI